MPQSAMRSLSTHTHSGSEWLRGAGAPLWLWPARTRSEQIKTNTRTLPTPECMPSPFVTGTKNDTHKKNTRNPRNAELMRLCDGFLVCVCVFGENAEEMWSKRATPNQPATTQRRSDNAIINTTHSYQCPTQTN